MAWKMPQGKQEFIFLDIGMEKTCFAHCEKFPKWPPVKRDLFIVEIEVGEKGISAESIKVYDSANLAHLAVPFLESMKDCFKKRKAFSLVSEIRAQVRRDEFDSKFPRADPKNTNLKASG